MMRSSSLACALCLSLSACGGGDEDESKTSSPKPIAGGGVSGSGLSGHADVFVVGADAAPLAGATIWIGEGAEATDAGVTGADGHLAVDDAALVSGAVVSATLANHVGASYVGVSGSLVTFVLASKAAPPADVEVSGTISGWDDLPTPAAGKYRAARVAAASPVELSLLDGISSANGTDSCFRPAGLAAECAFTLKVHPDSELVLAVIVDGDDGGTPSDPTDDSLQATGLAIGPGPGKGGASTGLVLGSLAESDLVHASLSLGQSSGLTQVIGVPGVADGNQAAVFPIFDRELPTYPVPRSVGELENVKLWAVGVGSDAAGDLRSLVLTRGLSATPGSDTLSLSLEDFLGSPSVTQNGSAFELTRATAGIHAVSLRGTNDHDLWILDQRTSVTPPIALDLGTPSVEVSATEVSGEFHPGFLADELSRRARQRL